MAAAESGAVGSAVVREVVREVVMAEEAMGAVRAAALKVAAGSREAAAQMAAVV